MRWWLFAAFALLPIAAHAAPTPAGFVLHAGAARMVCVQTGEKHGVKSFNCRTFVRRGAVTYESTPWGPYRGPVARFAQVVGGGGGIVTTGPGTDATLNSSNGFATGINLAHANTWTATQSSSAATAFSLTGAGAACPGAGTPIGSNTSMGSEYGVGCYGPGTAVNAIVIGPQKATQWNGAITGGSYSGALTLCGNNATVDICNGIFTDTAGYLALQGDLSLAGNGLRKAGFINQVAANTFGGQCTMAAATTCTVTTSVLYTNPICFVTQQAASALTPIAFALADFQPSTGNVIVSASVSNSATWAVICFGDPS